MPVADKGQDFQLCDQCQKAVSGPHACGKDGVNLSPIELLRLEQDKNPPYKTLSSRAKNAIYFSVAVSMFLSAMDQNVVVVSLPQIVRELGDASLLTWVLSSYMLTSSAVIVLYGRMSDIYGRRAAFLVALGGFLVGSVLCGAATNLWFLIICRGLQGLGGGGLRSLGLTIIGDITRPESRAKSMAAGSAVGTLASLIGPVVGGAITDASESGWRWIFYINLPFCLIAFISSWLAMRKFETPTMKLPVDVMGAFLVAAASICIVLFVLWGGSEEGYPWDSGVIIGLIVASIVLIGLFLAQEMHHPYPMMELSMFKTRNVALIMPIMFCVGIMMMAGFSFLPVYMQTVLGNSSIISGVKLFPLIGGFLFGAAISAVMLRKLNKVMFLLPEGAALLTTGLGLLYLIKPDTSYGMIAGFQVIAGLGMGSIISVTAVVLQNSVAPSQMGVCMSAFSFFMLMGGALGVAVIGALVNNSTTSNLLAGQSPQLAICNALDLAFLVSASPGVLVFLLSLFVQDTKPTEKSADAMAEAALGGAV